MGDKGFKTYEEQLDLLESRGMIVDVPDALGVLERVNYYRLSGYYYPFRQLQGPNPTGPKTSQFRPGTKLSRILWLYNFDRALRTTVFDALGPVEVSLRAALGHALAKIDPHVHLDPFRLGPEARFRPPREAEGPPLPAEASSDYTKWLERYQRNLGDSREDFVAHHQAHYNSRLPIWAAVEVMDWGSLTRLFQLSPATSQDAVAGDLGLTGRQLASWLKSLNVVRNICAHHGRLFNRNIPLGIVKMPKVGVLPDVDLAGPYGGRVFGNLSLIQHIRVRQGHGVSRVMSAHFKTFTPCPAVGWQHLGVNNSQLLGSLALWN